MSKRPYAFEPVKVGLIILPMLGLVLLELASKVLWGLSDLGHEVSRHVSDFTNWASGGMHRWALKSKP